MLATMDYDTLEDHDFIYKRWSVYTTDGQFHKQFRAKVCPGNHRHCLRADVDFSKESYYPWKMVEAMARHWKESMTPSRHRQLLSLREDLPALHHDEDSPHELQALLDEPDDDQPLLPDDGLDDSLSANILTEAERLQHEHQAREARLRQQFDFATCEQLLHQLHRMARRTGPQHQRGNLSGVNSFLLGAYSHGAFCGVSKLSQRLRELVKYLNGMFKHHLPGQTWSSFMVTFNNKCLPHRDYHNLKNTKNILLCLGNFQQGGLWLQGQPPDGLQAVKRRCSPHHFETGYVKDTRYQFVIFDPMTRHATQSWTGFRIGISAYTTRLAPHLAASDKKLMSELGFPPCSSGPSQPATEQLNQSEFHPSAGPSERATELLNQSEFHPSAGPLTLATTTTTDEQALPEGVTKIEYEAWEAKIAKYHRAAGHPTNRNLAKIISDGGHPSWKVQVALRHKCPACESLRSGSTSAGTIPPASTTPLCKAWQTVVVDVAEWTIPASRKKVKFVLLMDYATKLRVVAPLKTYDVMSMDAESAESVIQVFAERWLSVFPRPEVVIMDAAKTFTSAKMHEFLSSLNIVPHFIAEKEHWSHGTAEAAVQDVKTTSTAIQLEARDQDPFVTLHLAAAALNATEYTAGYSAFQWAYGRNYNISDEDQRTFASLPDGPQRDFADLVASRQKAEDIARKTRSQRVLSKLANTTVRQPLRQFHPMDLVKVWRKQWPKEVHSGPRGGLKVSGRPHWIGPGRVVFHEILPHQSAEDHRRHILWVIIGARLYRCSAHSVRMVTEAERFVYEASGDEKVDRWKSLTDILPRREYHDIVDEEPDERDVELPDLPPQPDDTTVQVPTRRVRQKTTFQPGEYQNNPVRERLHTEPVNDYGEGVDAPHGEPSTSSTTRPISSAEDPAPKRAKQDRSQDDDTPLQAKISWVEELYMGAAMEAEEIDINTAIQETNEFLKVEFDLGPLTSNRQRKMFENNPQAFLVKKMRDSEVVISKLPGPERELFQRAKAKEVSSFVSNEAVRKCLDSAEIKEAMDSQRIIRARWVLTWKLIPPEEQEEARKDASENPNTTCVPSGTRKAKARIVLLGFQHPGLLDRQYKTSAPVQSTAGRNLLYLMSSFHQWEIEGLDLATAFLQTQPTEADARLWTTGVEELREALGVGSEGIMRILRNIYGSTTAPRGLWLDLHKTLTALGATPVLAERCMWIWKSKEVQDGNHPKVIGVMGGHVDDFHRLGDGSPEWIEIKSKVDSAYKWGMIKKRNYRHAGTDVSTVTDGPQFHVEIDQTYYVETVPDIDIEPSRLRDNGALTPREVGACRTTFGSLQWLAVSTQPQICARCNILLTEVVTNGQLSHAREIQEMLGEVRRNTYRLKFFPFPTARHWKELVFITMGDQAHTNRPKGDSTGGMISMVAGPDCLQGKVCRMSILAWKTWKLQRKAISSNDAEVQAGAGNRENPREPLVKAAETQAMQVKGVLCTDSRGGYDAVEVNESPLLGLSNLRAALQAFQLRENLRRVGCELRWVASDYDLGDALTKKKMEARLGLVKFLTTWLWSIAFDPSFTSAKKSKAQGRSAIGAIDDYLGNGPEEPMTYNPLIAEEVLWSCNRFF